MRPTDCVEISPSHRAESLVLAVAKLAHLLAQFRNCRRAMPRCPIATGDQIERHLKLRLELITAGTLAVGVAIMLTRAAGLTLHGHIAEATERSHGAARKHAGHPIRGGTIHDDHRLGGSCHRDCVERYA